VFSKSGGFANDWDFFVYPAEVSNKESTVLITRDLAEALSALGEGKKVLWCPSADRVADDPERPLVAGFRRFSGTPHGPQLAAAAHVGNSLRSQTSRAVRLSHRLPFQLAVVGTPARVPALHSDTGAELRPIVQVIDDWFTNRKLGYVFEARVGKGSLLACSVDLIEIKDRPVAAQFRASILGYMDGEAFRPPSNSIPHFYQP
jgi:hypothetical protein